MSQVAYNMRRADAIRQIWPLMGYELRSKLQGDQPIPRGEGEQLVQAMQPQGDAITSHIPGAETQDDDQQEGAPA